MKFYAASTAAYTLGHIFSFGVLLDLPQELNRFRFIARLTRVLGWDDHLDLYRNHKLQSELAAFA